jgi:penicillin-binding protein 1C
VTGAAPIWRTLMDALQRRDANASMSTHAPAGLVQRPVRYASAIEPPRDEWFIRGTEQTLLTTAIGPGGSRTRITSPADHLLLALDPDIPLQAQQLSLTTDATAPARWSWRMDGRRLGPARAMKWPIWPGRHRLDLLDDAGKVRDTVDFEVRGAQIKGQSASAGRIRPSPP